jgi:predicted MFS family arabinose efflux permease
MFAFALALSLLLPNVWVLLIVMVCFGAGESVYDVAINAEGSALETLTGRAVMSGFHGMFSLGALGGSAAAAVMLRWHVPAAAQLAGVGVCIALLQFVASRSMLQSHPRGDSVEAHFAWPGGTLLVIGVLICLGMLAEGVMYNWSVLYVQQELHTPQDRAALAYVAFAGATAAMRFGGDWVRARVSERVMLLVFPLVSATAMALVLIIARPSIAICGMGLVGVGLATIVPILYNAATRVPGVSRAAAIASVSSIGYLGFMIGPPLIGVVAHATSLSVAMGTLILATLVLAVGSRLVPDVDTKLRG